MRILTLLTGTGLVAVAVVACQSNSPALMDFTDVVVDAGAPEPSPPPAPPSPPAPTFAVGGKVTGLSGTGLVLQNNAGDDIAVAKDGSFSFPHRLAAGAAFAVTVKKQPTAPSQTCTVSGGKGTIAAGDVTSVTVNCAVNTYAVGGTITGLAGSGLVLQNNEGDDLVVNANGTFAFGQPIASGADYAVTVKTQPGSPAQTCTVTEGTGKVEGAEITSVAIACTTNEYTVGGTVTGLAGTGLVLRMNDGETVAVDASGTFAFPTKLASGATFEVVASAQPVDPSQTCTVAGGTGMVGSADVSSIAVSCATNVYTVSGSASGLAGTAVLQMNGGEEVVVSSNGTFAFPTPLESGTAYAVTVKTQPGTPSQTCSLASASGTIGSGPVSDVQLTCATNTFAVSFTVSGLVGTGLLVRNGAGDDVAVVADGMHTFPLEVASGQTYSVSVVTHPTGPSQTCSVTHGTGTMGAAAVEDVAVTCVTDSFTVGGSVAGLTGSGLVLQNELGDDLGVSAPGGGFTFATPVLSGGAYAVSVKTQPTSPSQTCSVSAGAGTVTNGNVVGVLVNCTTDTFAVGGAVSGLAGTGLVLQNELGDDLTVNGNGDFAFATPVASGMPYAVTVKTQPTNPMQVCSVTYGAGTVGGGAVTNVAVSCVTSAFAVGGTVSGLPPGMTVQLRNNGGDAVFAENGPFTFPSPVDSGAAYVVTVAEQPPMKECTVTNGAGSIVASAVGDVTVTCVDLYCVRLGWKRGNEDWTCPGGSRMPTPSDMATLAPCVLAADNAKFGYYYDIAMSVGGCGCKWNGGWCGQPSIETLGGGRMCGDYTQLHICVVDH